MLILCLDHVQARWLVSIVNITWILRPITQRSSACSSHAADQKTWVTTSGYLTNNCWRKQLVCAVLLCIKDSLPSDIDLTHYCSLVFKCVARGSMMLSSSSPRAECLRQLQRAGLGWPRCGGEIFCNSSVGVGVGWRWCAVAVVTSRTARTSWRGVVSGGCLHAGTLATGPGDHGALAMASLAPVFAMYVCSVVLRFRAGPGLTVQSCVPVRMWQVTERGLEQNN